MITEMSEPADAPLASVGDGQRALEIGREAERRHAHGLIEPLPHTGPRAPRVESLFYV